MLEDALRHYGYIVLFIGSIFEGDGTLAIAAFLAHKGYFSLSIVLATATVASVLANEGLYHAARLKGKASFAGPRYDRLRQWVGQRSGLLLLLSRFIWGFRVVIPAACAVVGMTHRRFFFLNLTGAVVWAGVVGLIGYGCGQVFHGFRTSIEHHAGAGIVFLGVVAIASSLIWHRCDVKGLWHAIRHPREFGPEVAERLTEAAKSGRMSFWARLRGSCNRDLASTSPDELKIH